MTERHENLSPMEPAEGAASLGDQANAAAGSDSNKLKSDYSQYHCKVGLSGGLGHAADRLGR